MRFFLYRLNKFMKKGEGPAHHLDTSLGALLCGELSYLAGLNLAWWAYFAWWSILIYYLNLVDLLTMNALTCARLGITVDFFVMGLLNIFDLHSMVNLRICKKACPEALVDVRVFVGDM